MTPTAMLQSLLSTTYLSDEYKIELMPGLTDDEINEIAITLPTGQIPADIRELLAFAKGFSLDGMEDVTFDGIGRFGFENIFPSAVELAGDGLGNFWLLDIDSNGDWGSVFYVCHDPAVVIKQSEDLTQFMQHIDESAKDFKNTSLCQIEDDVIYDIWKTGHGFIAVDEARNSDDEVLKRFSLTLPDNSVVADLRNKPIRSGFAWGKFDHRLDTAIRCKDALIWGIEVREKRGFFSRLFGKR